MKEKIQDVTIPINREELIIYSEATKHLFSKSDQKLFETLPYKMPTNAKYLESQKRLVIKGTKKIFKEHPETPLKQVIIKKLAPMPDFLTAENLLKVVGYITQTWEECQAKNLEKALVFIADNQQ